MTTQRITVAGVTATSMVLTVPSTGAWWADLVLEDGTAVSGRVEISIGAGLTLSGTVAADASGTFGQQRHVRVVAGADGWRTLIDRQGYHNDGGSSGGGVGFGIGGGGAPDPGVGGVSASLVASDAASACGEVFADLAPSPSTLGVDYVREAGPASRALVGAIGTASWWVGYDGRTTVGARPTSTPTPGSFELLSFDPIAHMATLGMDDLGSIVIGSVLPSDERLPESLTVRELRIEVTSDTATVYAWCGGTGAVDRVAAALERIVDHVIDRRLLTPKRYRVFRMNGDRVELQAISSGCPDIGPISLFPGMAGTHANLTPGALVLVTFPDGDRSRPLITHFEGKGGNGWTPASITIDASGANASIKLGATAIEPPAWASKLRAELVKIAGALAAAVAPAGGGALTWAPSTDYPVAGVPSTSALGAAKTVCA